MHKLPYFFKICAKSEYLLFDWRSKKEGLSWAPHLDTFFYFAVFAFSF